MQLRLLFTRHRFENAAKSGAYSKRYGFICHVNSETALIWVRLPLRRDICILWLKMVNLARSLVTSHHICFSSLKRSKISLYFLWNDSQSTPSSVLLTLYSLVTFKRNETSSSVQVNRDVLFAMLKRIKWSILSCPDAFGLWWLRHDVNCRKTVPCKHFQTASITMRFWNRETVSIWNRVRENAA